MRPFIFSALMAVVATTSTLADPVPVEGMESDMFDWRFAEMPDGKIAYIARGEAFFPVSRQATIYKVVNVGAGWQVAGPASFSGQYSDMDPFVSRDGVYLYFCSIRPKDGAAKPDMDIFRVRRDGDGWGAPERLNASVNSDADELFATLDDAGNLYFGSDREGGFGGWDIYMARPDGAGGFLPAENLGAPVNSEYWQFNPTIAPAGDRLYFTGLNLPGGAGFGDIYMSVRDGDVWRAPEPVAAVNTAADEYHPSLTASGDGLYFIRRSQAHPDGQLYVLQGIKGRL